MKVKADLVQRLQEHDSQQQQPPPQQQQPEPEVAEQQPEQPETKLEGNTQENESTLTVIQPKEQQQQQQEEPKPKQLSPEERKQLAIELLTKKFNVLKNLVMNKLLMTQRKIWQE